MGTTLNDHANEAADPRIAVRRRLALLTARELEICLLHFVDARPQTLVADWLGITRATVLEHIESAIRKVPELVPLRTLAQGPTPKLRVLHLSQLPRGDSERGPFNSDEL